MSHPTTFRSEWQELWWRIWR